MHFCFLIVKYAGFNMVFTAFLNWDYLELIFFNCAVIDLHTSLFLEWPFSVIMGKKMTEMCKA